MLSGNAGLLEAIEDKLGARMDIDDLSVSDTSDDESQHTSSTGSNDEDGSEDEDGSDEEKESSVELQQPDDNTRALTVRQPFASAIMEEKKTYEFRTWAFTLPDDGRGRWLLCHSGATAAATDDQYRVVLAQVHAAWPEMPEVSELPKSAMLGWFHVSKIITADEWAEDYPLPTTYAWCIDEVLKLEPVKNISGAQGLWRPSAGAWGVGWVGDGAGAWGAGMVAWWQAGGGG